MQETASNFMTSFPVFLKCSDYVFQDSNIIKYKSKPNNLKMNVFLYPVFHSSESDGVVFLVVVCLSS